MNPADFQLLILKLSHHPHRLWLFLTEAVLLLAMFFLRTWGLPRQETFVRKIWFRTWTLGLYVFLAAWLAPRLWLGEEFNLLLKFWLGIGTSK